LESGVEGSEVSNREEFEAEFRKHPKFEGNAIYTDAMLERGSDGNYRFTIAEGAWWGWQASRAVIEISLPETCRVNDDEDYFHPNDHSRWLAVDQVVEVIESLGLQVKP
jgi:hypothetical protein